MNTIKKSNFSSLVNRRPDNGAAARCTKKVYYYYNYYCYRHNIYLHGCNTFWEIRFRRTPITRTRFTFRSICTFGIIRSPLVTVRYHILLLLFYIPAVVSRTVVRRRTRVRSRRSLTSVFRLMSRQTRSLERALNCCYFIRIHTYIEFAIKV